MTLLAGSILTTHSSSGSVLMLVAKSLSNKDTDKVAVGLGGSGIYFVISDNRLQIMVPGYIHIHL